MSKAVDCTNKTDGVYERSCRSYTRCTEGEAEVVNCGIDEAFNTKTDICENKWIVEPPCGTYRDCADSKDGSYPDLETQCRSFYTCLSGVFFGHTLCPAGLVFHKELSVCDYVDNVHPPCGNNITALKGKL
ncbi:hypothetical protein CHS0354_032803 [Potamilus streckersoni]|uniref:Chitin-binding type-2 domain-containing protein n=1 Tax=Potamilus streckersoni TaxID=2493646 RepID=A0AAE0S8Z2_9BIVA|nr:hypothetical protein CHS0354_032803 [Potamilus streckersoni]